MKILRKILRGLSLTSVLFVFQACYGTPKVDPDKLPEPLTQMSAGQDTSAGQETSAEENSEERENCAE